MLTKILASLIRGGTSKGLFINKNDLPSDIQERDQLLLSIMGSPDPSGIQLNGIGGGISSTSKVALISKSSRSNIDVDYLFGQVSLKEPKIDWAGSCGNLAAAVGLYALNSGIIKRNESGETCVRVWQENLGYEIRVYLPEEPVNELVTISGVPGVSAPIYVDFINPSNNKSLLPTNKPIHELILPLGEIIQATLIFGANPTIFVRAADLGLTGVELPSEIDYKRLEPIIVALAKQGAGIMGITYNAAIRVAWVAHSHNYSTTDGVSIRSEQLDILSRISTEGRIHHAYTGTGSINLACAAKIPGTIPYQIVNSLSINNINSNLPIKLGHPQGVMQINADVAQNQFGDWIANSSGFIRTAKIIMIGDVFI